MSATVTPSAPGSHLPADARPQFSSSRQQRPESEEQAAAAVDTADISAPGYGARDSGGNPEVSAAISFTQTQGGFLQVVGEALDRMGELSVLCQDNSKSQSERVNFTVEFTQLQDFISEIGAKKFNGQSLFSGKSLAVRIEQNDVALPIEGVDLNAKEPNGGIGDAVRYASADVNTAETAAAALVRIQKAVSNLSEMQGKVSLNLQRLNLSTEQMSVLTQNLSAANHRINDIDLAKNLTQGARSKMLGQAGAALSTQANAAPQAAIRLLQ